MELEMAVRQSEIILLIIWLTTYLVVAPIITRKTYKLKYGDAVGIVRLIILFTIFVGCGFPFILGFLFVLIDAPNAWLITERLEEFTCCVTEDKKEVK